MKRYVLDRELYKKACAEEATNEDIDAWLYHLCDVLLVAGFEARVVQSGYDKWFMVNDVIKEDVGCMVTEVTLQGVLASLEELGVTVELHPDFALRVPEPEKTLAEELIREELAVH